MTEQDLDLLLEMCNRASKFFERSSDIYLEDTESNRRLQIEIDEYIAKEFPEQYDFECEAEYPYYGTRYSLAKGFEAGLLPVSAWALFSVLLKKTKNVC